MEENTPILPKLKPKQLQFCKEFIVDRNATQAAIRAGYGVKSAKLQGHRLSTSDNCLSHIEALERTVAADLGITHTYLLNKTKEILDANTDSPMVRLKAVELLGKHLGTFTEDQNIKAPQVWTGIEIDYGDGTLKVVSGTGQLPEKQAPGSSSSPVCVPKPLKSQK